MNQETLQQVKELLATGAQDAYILQALKEAQPKPKPEEDPEPQEPKITADMPIDELRRATEPSSIAGWRLRDKAWEDHLRQAIVEETEKRGHALRGQERRQLAQKLEPPFLVKHYKTWQGDVKSDEPAKKDFAKKDPPTPERIKQYAAHVGVPIGGSDDE